MAVDGHTAAVRSRLGKLSDKAECAPWLSDAYPHFASFPTFLYNSHIEQAPSEEKII